MKKAFLLLISIMIVVACSSDDDSNSNPNKLVTPVLLTPSNNSTVNSDYYSEFTWSNVANADQYLIQISSASNFSNIVLDLTIDAEDYTDYGCYMATGELENQAAYYWRVRAFGAGYDPSDYSESFSFTVNN